MHFFLDGEEAQADNVGLLNCGAETLNAASRLTTDGALTSLLG